jgi:hypothetical protein
MKSKEPKNLSSILYFDPELECRETVFSHHAECVLLENNCIHTLQMNLKLCVKNELLDFEEEFLE